MLQEERTFCQPRFGKVARRNTHQGHVPGHPYVCAESAMKMCFRPSHKGGPNKHKDDVWPIASFMDGAGVGKVRMSSIDP